jgi:hypothetical protein
MTIIKLKKALFWALPCGLLCLASCRKTSLTSLQVKPGQINYITSGASSLALVPIDLARQVAIYRPKSDPAINLNQNLSAQTPRAIQSEFTYNNAQGYADFYVFNYADGGFIIISAELKDEPIMAFVPQGAWDPNHLPDGVSYWTRRSMGFVEYLRAKNDSIRPVFKQLWAYVLPPGTVAATSLPGGSVSPDKTPGPCTPNAYVVYTGPLVQTVWGQGCGYNEDCPANTAGPCDFNLTGCVATAMAQICYYHQAPAGYAYSTMPLNMENGQVNNASLQSLMANIGADVDMDYGPTGSSTTSGTISPAFNDLGYANTVTVLNDNPVSNIESNINSNDPVLLFGVDAPTNSGHCWVCDGYALLYNENMLCAITTQPDYYHMNWGWGEVGVTNTYIGWYDYGAWAVNGYDFSDEDFGCVYNIVP